MNRLLVLAAFVGTVACGRTEPQSSTAKEQWDASDAPTSLGVATRNYAAIPTEANLTDAGLFWGGDYWATLKGGISQRWRDGNDSDDYRDHMYRIPTAREVSRMSGNELSRLSPAEKLDVMLGRDTFPLVKSERSVTELSVVNGRVPEWYGICHGWAAAATRERQPGNRTRVRLRDGRMFDLSYADLTAYLSYLYSDNSAYQFKFIGNKCDTANAPTDAYGRPLDRACRDTNPATLHLVATTFIAEQHKPFIADMTQTEEVWNYPVVGYGFRYSNLRPFVAAADALAAVRAPGTAQLVDVAMRLHLANAADAAPTATAPTRTYMDVFYTLELDAQGTILGGEWSDGRHPDFLWEVVSAPQQTTNGLVNYAFVQSLIQASRTGNIVEAPGGSGGNPPDEEPDQPVPGGDHIRVARLEVQLGGGLFEHVVATGEALTRSVDEVVLYVVKRNGVVRELASEDVDGGRFTLRGQVFRENDIAAFIVEARDDDGRVLERERVAYQH